MRSSSSENCRRGELFFRYITARSNGICGALIVCAWFAYVGILVEARKERNLVVDATVYSGRLAAEGTGGFNTAFLPSDGSAALGRNYRFHSFAHWAVAPRRSLAASPKALAREKRWLYIMADAPQFFSADGYARVYVDNSLAGEIEAVTSKDGAFAGSPERQSIVMPPARTFGYRFPLADDRCSSIACDLSIRGRWTFWHVYRFAIVGETPRFDTSAAP